LSDAVIVRLSQPKGEAVAYKITDKCIACGTCKDECPVEAISEGKPFKIDDGKCIDCGACASVCPVEAIEAP
jgi:ferredoxin